ncbi:MAG: hypothetical protein JSS20_17470, partial [Proteobacteria bacterium]|nr:hypothetical protein [Pseudomonadota bacterium]
MTTQIELPYKIGFDYGIGVDSRSASRSGTAIEGEPTGVLGASGASQYLTIKRIQTTSELEDALHISAEATAGIGLFPASANARFDFAKDCKVQSMSLVLLVTHQIAFGFKQIVQPKLSAHAAEIVSNPAAFQDRYGDQFIVGMTTGALFYGVLRIDTQSEESRQSIDASISGSYGLAFSGEAASNLSSALKKTASTCTASIYFEGGDIGQTHTNPQTPQDLLDAHAAWYKSLVDANGNPTSLAKPYSALLLPYTVAEGPLPPNAIDMQHMRDVLSRCAKLRSQTLDRLNLLDYILAHNDEFEFHPGDLTIDQISTLRGQVAQDDEQIARAASFAMNYPDKAVDPELFEHMTGTPYEFHVIPSNTPLHNGGVKIPTPNFGNAQSHAG